MATLTRQRAYERVVAEAVDDACQQTTDRTGAPQDQRAPQHVSVRDLSRQTSQVLTQAQETGRPVVVTYRNVPTWLLVPLDRQQVASDMVRAAQLADPDTRYRAALDEEAELEEADALLEKGEASTLAAARHRRTAARGIAPP